MTKKLSALLLALLICFSVIIMTACGDETSEESSKAQQSEEVSDEDTDLFVKENGVRNFGGQTVTLFTHAQHEYSTIVVPETMTGEPINDAYYDIRQKLKSDYGIDLQLKTCDYFWDGAEVVREDVMSGLHEIQIADLTLLYMATLGVEGNLIDLNTVENGYIHTEQPWWDQSVMRDLTIKNKLWFLAGDAILEDDQATWAVYFNKDLVDTYGLENPYDLVKNGEWTLDKMYELVKQVHHEKDGAMEFVPGSGDIFGIIVQSYDCYAMMLGANQKMILSDGNDLTLRVASEENVNTFHKVMDIVLDEVNCGVADFYGSYRAEESVYDVEYKVFASGGALFMPYYLHIVNSDEMRDAEIKYGILPMPKANDLQENYATSVTVYWCEVLGIPTGITGDLLDATCYTMEALAYYGMQKVTPEYYTRTLTHKRFTDQESADMLDLIFRNRVYDTASVYNFGNDAGVGMLGFYTSLLGSRSSDIMSLWESREEIYKNAIEYFLSDIEG